MEDKRQGTDDELLTIKKMTAIVNERRNMLSRVGKKPYAPISEQWIRKICVARRDRERSGLVSIPAFKVNPSASRSPWVCRRGEFEELVGALAELAHNAGRPKKKVEGKASVAPPPPIVFGEQLTNALRGIMPDLSEIALDTPLLAALTGRAVCPHCQGEGCQYCDDGWAW